MPRGPLPVGYDWTRQYRTIVAQAAQLPGETAIPDGAMVVQDEHGRADLDARTGAARPLAFDLPMLDSASALGSGTRVRRSDQSLDGVVARAAILMKALGSKMALDADGMEVREDMSDLRNSTGGKRQSECLDHDRRVRSVSSRPDAEKRTHRPHHCSVALKNAITIAPRDMLAEALSFERATVERKRVRPLVEQSKVPVGCRWHLVHNAIRQKGAEVVIGRQGCCRGAQFLSAKALPLLQQTTLEDRFDDAWRM